MQTVVQVISGKTKSLRDTIVNDKRLEDFGLEVAEHKRQTRPQGWAKIHMPGELGAINIQWHGASREKELAIRSALAPAAVALSHNFSRKICCLLKSAAVLACSSPPGE